MKILSEEEIKEILAGIEQDDRTTPHHGMARRKLSYLNTEFANFVTDQKIKHKIRVARVNGADHVQLTDKEADRMVKTVVTTVPTLPDREM